MSGGLYDLFGGYARFGYERDIPKELEGATIKLKPTNGDAIELEAEAACMAETVKSILVSKGASAEIPCPMKKDLLAKVVEYMKYHKDTPPGDLKTPLTSDNLVECGALKWDAAFVNTDRTQLFEYVYAGSALGLESLVFIAGAKIAQAMKGKSSDKIRKDLGCADDLPSGEENDLEQAYEEKTKNSRAKFEESGLAVSAAMVHGVQSAAASHGGLTSATGEVMSSSANLKSWRSCMWSAAVFVDWNLLKGAPSDIKGDRELMFGAIRSSKGAALKFAASALKSDRDIVLAAVEGSGESFAEAADSLKEDKDFVRKAIMIDGKAMVGAAAKHRGDQQFILEAAKSGKGAALKGAVERLQGDRGFVLDCVKGDPEAFLYAAKELRDDRDAVLAVVRANGRALQYVPFEFKADREIVLAAGPAMGMAFGHASCTQAPAVLMYETGTLKDQQAFHVGVPKDVMPQFTALKMEKTVCFTALSTMTPNMGQSNYIAANSYLDKLPQYQRPEIDGIALSWGTVGGMGMRWKAFASQDFMNQTPDLLLGIPDACKILHVAATKLDPPEWMAANFFDEGTRNYMLAPSAGTRGNEDSLPFTPSWPVAPVKAEKLEDEEPADREASRQSESGPLGGWPVLAAQVQPSASPSPLAEGCRVQLAGLKSKKHLTGTVTKIHGSEGKCRIALDGAKGHALVKLEMLQVIMAAA